MDRTGIGIRIEETAYAHGMWTGPPIALSDPPAANPRFPRPFPSLDRPTIRTASLRAGSAFKIIEIETIGIIGSREPDLDFVR